MKEKSDKVFLLHILESIEAIKEFSKDLTLEEFSTNRMINNAIIRELEIMGEAAKNISEDLKSENKDVDWRGIVGTRDKLIHYYFGIKTDLIFQIIMKDIPVLENQILKINQGLK